MAALELLAVTRPRLHLLTVSHQGQLGALAAGVRIATRNVVVLLDDDVLPAPGTIAGHVAAHRDRPGSVVVGPMPVAVDGGLDRSRDGRHPGVATRLYAAEYDAHLDALGHRGVDVLDVLWTGNLSIGRDDCLRVGLPSPAFTAHYHADQDLGLRLRAAGLVGRLDPSLVAHHFHDRTDADFLRDARRQGEGRAALHRAHPDRLGPFAPPQLVADLPVPLRAVVGVVGPTRLAEPIARALMALGRYAARAGWTGLEVDAAKLARRLMQWHGAVGGSTPD